jgi:hypothetical protein
MATRMGARAALSVAAVVRVAWLVSWAALWAARVSRGGGAGALRHVRTLQLSLAQQLLGLAHATAA